MKRHFFTGLALLLPFVVTTWIVIFFVNLLTSPFQGLLESAIQYYDFTDQQILFFTVGQVIHLTSKLIILCAIFGIVLLFGMLGRSIFLHYFVKMGNFIIHRIPVVNKIYKALQDVVSTLFESEYKNFSDVVLVPFPHSNALSMGLITNGRNKDDANELVAVFLPATPNPTIGFMLHYKKDQLIYLKMKVEEAVKIIVSCGVMFDQETKDANEPT